MNVDEIAIKITNPKVFEALEFLDGILRTSATNYINMIKELDRISKKGDNADLPRYRELIVDIQTVYNADLRMLFSFIMNLHETAVNLSKDHENFRAEIIAINAKAAAKDKSDTAMPEESLIQVSTDGL